MTLDINGKVMGIFDKANYSITQISNYHQYFAIIDVLIVGILIYYFYLFLSQTRALGILYGLFILGLLWFIGQKFELTLLNTILKWLLTPILIAFPVVFQPELRSGLEKLGRSTKFVTDIRRLSMPDLEVVIDEIIKATNILSKNNYGALIVISRFSGLREYIQTGQEIYALVSNKLLVNIFTPKAPLHDGAVIISGQRIIAASTTLPISEDVMDLSLGTRHKAALSLSMETDAVSIIISEETGAVSMAVDGRIQRNINNDDLKDRLIKLLSAKKIK